MKLARFFVRKLFFWNREMFCLLLPFAEVAGRFVRCFTTMELVRRPNSEALPSLLPWRIGPSLTGSNTLTVTRVGHFILVSSSTGIFLRASRVSSYWVPGRMRRNRRAHSISPTCRERY